MENRKPYEAFRAYAAKKLGVAPEAMNGGGPVSAATATPYPGLPSVGEIWANQYNTSAGGRYRDARGWATQDGTVITAEQNLGLLFDAAGVWTQPTLSALQLAEHLTWSFGMSYRLATGTPLHPVPAPALAMKPDGRGTLEFVVDFRPPGPGGAGGGPSDHTKVTVTLAPDRTATLTRSPV